MKCNEQSSDPVTLQEEIGWLAGCQLHSPSPYRVNCGPFLCAECLTTRHGHEEGQVIREMQRFTITQPGVDRSFILVYFAGKSQGGSSVYCQDRLNAPQRIISRDRSHIVEEWEGKMKALFQKNAAVTVNTTQFLQDWLRWGFGGADHPISRGGGTRDVPNLLARKSCVIRVKLCNLGIVK